MTLPSVPYHRNVHERDRLGRPETDRMPHRSARTLTIVAADGTNRHKSVTWPGPSAAGHSDRHYAQAASTQVPALSTRDTVTCLSVMRFRRPPHLPPLTPPLLPFSVVSESSPPGNRSGNASTPFSDSACGPFRLSVAVYSSRSSYRCVCGLRDSHSSRRCFSECGMIGDHTEHRAYVTCHDGDPLMKSPSS